MKIEYRKITEAIKEELFEFYLTKGWFECMSFKDFLQGCKKNGTKICKEQED